MGELLMLEVFVFVEILRACRWMGIRALEHDGLGRWTEVSTETQKGKDKHLQFHYV